MLSDDQYAARRRPQLEKAGIDLRSIAYLIALERGNVNAVIHAVSQLTGVAVWEGRVCILQPTGIKMRYVDKLWRVEQP